MEGLLCGGVALEKTEYQLSTEVEGSKDGSVVAQLPGGGFVVLDTNVTDELEAEGWARDAVRQIADARRDADLDVSDRINLTLTATQARVDALVNYRNMIASETLAVEVTINTDTRLAEDDLNISFDVVVRARPKIT